MKRTIRQWLDDQWHLHRGGLIQSPDPVRLDAGGCVIVAEVWHWRWWAPACNWNNRRKHGWIIVAKTRGARLHENVLMVKYLPPSERTLKAVA